MGNTFSTLRCMFTSADSLRPDSPLAVHWLGEDPRDATEILADIAAAYAGRKGDSSRAPRALAEWLRDGEWKAVKAIRKLCEEASELSWKSIEKAKSDMAIESERRPRAGQCWPDPYADTREERERKAE